MRILGNPLSEVGHASVEAAVLSRCRASVLLRLSSARFRGNQGQLEPDSIVELFSGFEDRNGEKTESLVDAFPWSGWR